MSSIWLCCLEGNPQKDFCDSCKYESVNKPQSTEYGLMCLLEHHSLTSNYFGYSFIWIPRSVASDVALFCLNRVDFCCFSTGWKLFWQIVCDVLNVNSVQQTSQLSWHILYVKIFISCIISYSTSSSWFKHMCRHNYHKLAGLQLLLHQITNDTRLQLNL